MIIMALDHVRDFFHKSAGLFAPEDLSKTTAALFMTRWVTHFCAPVFMFTAGIGAFLWWQRGRTKAELSKYLLKRGLWLILLEIIAIRLALNFNFSMQYPLFLIVLWALGGCMIGLALLVWLPLRWIAVFSLAVLTLHNALDGIAASQFGGAAPLWIAMIQRGAFPVAGAFVVVGYPLVPWLAAMAGGFCFGQVFQWTAIRRRQFLLRTGVAATLGFFLLRAANIYGDPSAWKGGILSFLNCTKNPPSLEFLLMTLGPALLLLWWFDPARFSDKSPLLVFGRVPLFYFLVHFFVIHAAALVTTLVRYGSPALHYVFNPVPAAGAPPKMYPPDYGFSLGVVYFVWITLVVLMYPLCRWFGRVKAGRRYWWLAYM